MKDNQKFLIVGALILAVILIGPKLGLFSSGGIPVSGVSAFHGVVVEDGTMIISGKVDCRAGGKSVSQSGPESIINDVEDPSIFKYDIICIGGGVYEFFVDRGNGWEKFDTLGIADEPLDVTELNIIKGDCGGYCNPSYEAPDCRNFKITGSTLRNIKIPGTTEWGSELGPPESDGTCPDRCVSYGAMYNGPNPAFNPTYVMYRKDGLFIGREFSSSLFITMDGEILNTRPNFDTKVCVYTKVSRNFYLPSGRLDCKICSNNIYIPPTPEPNLECTNDGECGTGYKCTSNECVEKTCPICLETTEWENCIQGQQLRIINYCDASTNFECQEKYEFKGCLEGVDCELDNECNSGYLCSEGLCVPDIECSSDSECQSGMVCEGNNCIFKNLPPTITGEEPSEPFDLTKFLEDYWMYILGVLGIFLLIFLMKK